MKEIIEKLRYDYNSSCIFVLNYNLVYVYDRDAKIIEFITNINSRNNVICFEYKYLKHILSKLKFKKISYVVLDSDSNYDVFEYYYLEKNNYFKFINFSSKYNFIRKPIINMYNYIYLKH